jgi:putative ABC transport system permease protein
VLERTRDFAVLKATGVSGSSIFASVVVQAVAMSLTAAAIAAGLAIVLKPLVALSIEFEPSTFLLLLVVASGAGVLASLVGVRRALGVDPALAFG